jgi:N-acetylglutamate synthase-like GNAT family acetyltransferase
MKITSLHEIKRDLVKRFFEEHWGSSQMVVSTGVYHCDQLDGFALISETKEIIGLITYVIKNDVCEIISLDSLIESKGIGTMLVTAVENAAREHGCKILKLITTNDNLQALKFYQKRGFRLMEIYRNAVEEARKIKPEIPKVGYYGIPIVDEILLEKRIY